MRSSCFGCCTSADSAAQEGESAADRGTIKCNSAARREERRRRLTAADEGFKSEVAWLFDPAAGERRAPTELSGFSR